MNHNVLDSLQKLSSRACASSRSSTTEQLACEAVDSPVQRPFCMLCVHCPKCLENPKNESCALCAACHLCGTSCARS